MKKNMIKKATCLIVFAVLFVIVQCVTWNVKTESFMMISNLSVTACIALGCIVLTMMNVVFCKKNKVGSAEKESENDTENSVLSDMEESTARVTAKSVLCDMAMLLIYSVIIIIAVNIMYKVLFDKHILRFLYEDRSYRQYMFFDRGFDIFECISIPVKAILISAIVSLIFAIDIKKKGRVIKDNIALWVLLLVFCVFTGVDSYIVLSGNIDELMPLSISIDRGKEENISVKVGDRLYVEEIKEIIKDADELEIYYVDGGHNVKNPSPDSKESKIASLDDEGYVTFNNTGTVALCIVTYNYDEEDCCKCTYSYIGDYVCE